MGFVSIFDLGDKEADYLALKAAPLWNAGRVEEKLKATAALKREQLRQ